MASLSSSSKTSNFVKTHDTSTLDPNLDNFKYDCAGVGSVRVDEGDVAEELIEYSLQARDRLVASRIGQAGMLPDVSKLQGLALTTPKM